MEKEEKEKVKEEENVLAKRMIKENDEPETRIERRLLRNPGQWDK